MPKQTGSIQTVQAATPVSHQVSGMISFLLIILCRQRREALLQGQDRRWLF